MSVQRRLRGGKVRWEVRWRHDGRQLSRTFDRKADAVAFEVDQRRREQMGAHAPVEPTAAVLEDWLRQWWTRDSVRWEASTRRVRASLLDRWVVPYLGRTRLRDLGRTQVRDWRARLVEDRVSPTQANHALSVLSAALGAAVDDGLLPANPCTRLGKLKVHVARPRALTPEEVERVRAAMPTPRDALLVSLLCYAGLRPGEALALRWESVDRVIVVDENYVDGLLRPTKTTQRRTVEVVEPVADELRRLRPKVRELGALVCPSTTGGRINLNNWRNRVWGPACDRAGIRATPYDGRHTYASLLIHEGRSVPYVTAAMGHASPTTTLRHYAHVFDSARLATATSMIDAIRAARERLRESGVRPECDENAIRVLSAPRRRTRK